MQEANLEITLKWLLACVSQIYGFIKKNVSDLFFVFFWLKLQLCLSFW